MIGRRIGAYRVESELGSGGMGSVFRATVVDAASPLAIGTVVALKVIHAHIAGDKDGAARFLLEVEAGRRVRDEHVVRTLDAGEATIDGHRVPWLAMELVEGRTLRALFVDHGRLPEALLREIGSQAARGLAAIHAERIVHRDVKPENVLVTADHRVRLMDLGVARLLDGSTRLTADGAFSGSLFYAAPEQFRGSDAGPAADLYALGIVLFEMAVGRHPFPAAHAAALLDAHLRRIPERADVAERQLSRSFADLVEDLLEKDAKRRPLGAELVAEALESGEMSRWARARAHRTAAADAPRPRIPVRRDVEPVGQEAARTTLSEAWRDACAGAGRVVLVEGEAGIGKTRLVDAFAESLPRVEAQVLYGAFTSEGGIGGLADAVVERVGGADLETSLSRRLGAASLLVGPFAAALRGLPPIGAPEPLRADGLNAGFSSLLRSFAAEKPTLWIVEDAHEAPPEARSTLLSLARSLAGTRALLLVTSRRGLPDEFTAALDRTGALRRVALPRLAADDVAELLRRALGSPALASRLAPEITERSDGVPLFVLETIRELRDAGAIAPAQSGTLVVNRPTRALEVPAAVRDLVIGRLRGLSRSERTLLDVSAVQGFEFDADLTARVLDERRVRLLQDVAELERRTGLVRAAGRGFRFDHHQVRDTLLAELSESLREEYHGLLAEAIVARDGVDRASPAALAHDSATSLVLHGLRGNRAALVEPWIDTALARLEGTYRHAEALEVCERALAARPPPSTDRRVALLLKRGGRLEYLGRRAELDETYAEATKLADTTGSATLRASVRCDYGWQLWTLARYDDAARVMEEALPLAKASGVASLEARAERNLGLIATSLMRYADARRHHERHLALALASNDRRGEATAQGNLGLVEDNEGRLGKARERYLACAAIARELGVRRLETTSAGNIGLLDLRAGDLCEAETAFLRFLEGSRAIGDRSSESYALVNLGYALVLQGAIVEANDVLEAVLALTRELGQRRVEGYALERRGLAFRLSGDLVAAKADFEASLALRREIHDAPGEMDALLRLADVARLSGDEDGAHIWLDRAIEFAARGGFADGRVTAACLAVEWGGGDVPVALASFRAHEATSDACERVENLVRLATATGDASLWAEATRLSDRLVERATPSRRETMKANVPAHRAVVAHRDRRPT